LNAPVTVLAAETCSLHTEKTTSDGYSYFTEIYHINRCRDCESSLKKGLNQIIAVD